MMVKQHRRGGGNLEAETKRKRGRPSVYSQAKADEICARLAGGESLREICRTEGMPEEAVVRGWVIDDREGFSAQYARVRDLGLDCQNDYLLSVAGDKTRDPRCRAVEVDALKWRLCKMAPKRYGDRQMIEHSGSVDLVSAIAAGKKRAGECS
jgi:hypothetical protein